MISARTSAPIAAQAVVRADVLPGKRGRADSLKRRAKRPRCVVSLIPSWTSASSRTTDGQSLLSDAASFSAGQSAEIEGLSTKGVSWASSSRVIACHSAEALSLAEAWLAAAIAGTAASSTASSGRASQTSLQREQRTVRPAAPSVARLMA